MASLNNRYTSCPALMSDGRLFTDFRPRSNAVEDLLRSGSSSYDYRQQLIKNASSLMSEDRRAAAAVAGCRPCQGAEVPMPEFQVETCDNSTCALRMADVNGLGRGRDFDHPSSVAPVTESGVPGMLPQGVAFASRLGPSTQLVDGDFYPIEGLA